MLGGTAFAALRGTPDVRAPAGDAAAATGSVATSAVIAPTTSDTGSAEWGGPSFFEPFNHLDTHRWFISDGWVNGDQQGCTWSRDNVKVSHGMLTMTLDKAKNRLRPYRCAELRTVDHLGYGTYEARIRTAAGSGLNTAMFTYRNETRDEIDFEFLGRNPGQVQLNYYVQGKGGHEMSPELGTNASAGFNNYAMVWVPEGIRWYVNGRLVRTVDASALPRSPGSLILSLWNGSSAENAWLGPFDAPEAPVTAQVDWVAFTRMGEHCLFPQSITCREQ